MSRIQIVALVVSIILILLIFQLIRRRKLKEQYSLLWFLTVAVILGLALWDAPLFRLSHAIGVAIPSNTLFLLALMFLFGMALHFSLLVSRLTDQTKMLAQKLALLDRDLRAQQSKAAPAKSTGEQSGPESGDDPD